MILKPPTNYTGSKHKLIEQLVKYFPNKDTVDTFYDVFCGGLSVTMNVDYNKFISNDILTPLIQFYEILNLSDNQDETLNKILSYKIDKNSQEEYNRVRAEFNIDRDPYKFFALVCSCNNNMARFNLKGQFNQTFGKRTINQNTIDKLTKYMDQMKLKNIKFTNLNYTDLLFNYKPTNKDFIYLDSPYGLSSLSEAGYSATWTKEHEENLYTTIDNLDKDGIRFAFSGVSIHKGNLNPNLDKLSKYKIINLEFDYEKVAKDKNLETQEILVINY